MEQGMTTASSGETNDIRCSHRSVHQGSRLRAHQLRRNQIFAINYVYQTPKGEERKLSSTAS